MNAMSLVRLVDSRVRHYFPHPVAFAWHRVLVVTNHAERIRQITAFLDVVCRYLVVTQVPEYLRGEPVEVVEVALRRLGRPSLGTWVGLLRELLRANRSRVDGDAFAPVASSWYFTRKGKPSDAAKMLDRLVQLRNQEAHGTRGMSPGLLAERCEEMVDLSRRLLESLGWLCGYRLVRPVSMRPRREGGMRGKLQPLLGVAAHSEPLGASWDVPLLEGHVYLVNPVGEAFLELFPLLQVRDDPVQGAEQVYLLDSVGRDGQLVHTSLQSGSKIREPVVDCGSSQGFSAWLDARKSRVSLLSSEAGVTALRVADWIPGGSGGEDLGDRYQTLGLLGEGGMARVYRVRDRWLDQDFALKVLTHRYDDDEKLAERFRREARIMRDLRHPGILELVDAGQLEDGRLYLKMPVVSGGSLAEQLDGVPLPEETVRAWASQLAEALGVLHRVGVLHRDIKPSNILLQEDGRVVLSDFGVALHSGSTRLTRTMEQLGTLAYLAPEQRLGRPASVSSDIYSMGLVLHALLTGREVAERPGRGIDGPLGELIRSMGSSEPSERPSSAEVAAYFRESSNEKPSGEVVARPETDPGGEAKANEEETPDQAERGVSPRPLSSLVLRLFVVALLALPWVGGAALALLWPTNFLLAPNLANMGLVVTALFGVAWVISAAPDRLRGVSSPVSWIAIPVALVLLSTLQAHFGQRSLERFLQRCEYTCLDGLITTWEYDLETCLLCLTMLTMVMGIGAVSLGLVARRAGRARETSLTGRLSVLLALLGGVGIWAVQETLLPAFESTGSSSFIVTGVLVACMGSSLGFTGASTTTGFSRARWLHGLCTVGATAATALGVLAWWASQRKGREFWEGFVDEVVSIGPPAPFVWDLAEQAMIPTVLQARGFFFAWLVLALVCCLLRFGPRGLWRLPFERRTSVQVVALLVCMVAAFSWNLHVLHERVEQIAEAYQERAMWRYLHFVSEDVVIRDLPGFEEGVPAVKVRAVDENHLVEEGEFLLGFMSPVGSVRDLMAQLRSCWCRAGVASPDCGLESGCVRDGSVVVMRFADTVWPGGGLERALALPIGGHMSIAGFYRKDLDLPLARAGKPVADGTGVIVTRGTVELTGVDDGAIWKLDSTAFGGEESRITEEDWRSMGDRVSEQLYDAKTLFEMTEGDRPGGSGEGAWPVNLAVDRRVSYLAVRSLLRTLGFPGPPPINLIVARQGSTRDQKHLAAIPLETSIFWWRPESPGQSHYANVQVSVETDGLKVTILPSGILLGSSDDETERVVASIEAEERTLPCPTDVCQAWSDYDQAGLASVLAEAKSSCQECEVVLLIADDRTSWDAVVGAIDVASTERDGVALYPRPALNWLHDAE